MDRITLIKWRLAVIRLVMSTVLLLNFMTNVILHAKATHDAPNTPRCVARDDINHPVYRTALTDIEATKDVGLMFFRVNCAGMAL